MFGTVAAGEAMLILSAVVLYFLPAVLAYAHSHRQTPAILVVNLFLGWTLIGWVGALVWSLYKPVRG